MNRAILIPRRNSKSVSRIARFVWKLRFYRSIGLEFIHAVPMAWRVSK